MENWKRGFIWRALKPDSLRFHPLEHKSATTVFDPLAALPWRGYFRTVQMLRKIHRGWHSARALQLYARGDPSRALRSVEAMGNISPLSSAERMWTYYPLVLLDRLDEAFDILDEVCRETEGSDDENVRFVNLCARATRAEINDDEPLRERLVYQAKQLKPKAAVKMWSEFG
jgi:hypothetical protein